MNRICLENREAIFKEFYNEAASVVRVWERRGGK